MVVQSKSVGDAMKNMALRQYAASALHRLRTASRHRPSFVTVIVYAYVSGAMTWESTKFTESLMRKVSADGSIRTQDACVVGPDQACLGMTRVLVRMTLSCKPANVTSQDMVAHVHSLTVQLRDSINSSGQCSTCNMYFRLKSTLCGFKSVVGAIFRVSGQSSPERLGFRMTLGATWCYFLLPTSVAAVVKSKLQDLNNRLRRAWPTEELETDHEPCLFVCSDEEGAFAMKTVYGGDDPAFSATTCFSAAQFVAKFLAIDCCHDGATTVMTRNSVNGLEYFFRLNESATQICVEISV